MGICLDFIPGITLSRDNLQVKIIASDKQPSFDIDKSDKSKPERPVSVAADV